MPTQGTDKPTRPQTTALNDMFHLSLSRSKPTKSRVTALLQSGQRKNYEKDLYLLNRKYLGPENPHAHERVSNQSVLASPEAFRSLPGQIKILTGDTFQGGGFTEVGYPSLPVNPEHIYFADAVLDWDYAESRMKNPIKHFDRVPVLKMSYLERRFGISNAYQEIGMLGEWMVDQLSNQFEFGNEMKGHMNSANLTYDPEAEAIRRKIEENVPGEVMLIDVDTYNWTIGRGLEVHVNGYNRFEVNASDVLFSFSTFDVGLLCLLNQERFTRAFSGPLVALAEHAALKSWPSSLAFGKSYENSNVWALHRWGDLYTSGNYMPVIGLRPNVTEFI